MAAPKKTVRYEEELQAMRESILIDITTWFEAITSHRQEKKLYFTEPWSLGGSIQDDNTPVASIISRVEGELITELVITDSVWGHQYSPGELDFENLLTILDALEFDKISFTEPDDDDQD